MVCKGLPYLYHSSSLLYTYSFKMLYNLFGFVGLFFFFPSFFIFLPFITFSSSFGTLWQYAFQEGVHFPLPGNSHEELLFWTFPRTLCVIGCPRKGLPIDMYLISFLLPSVSCSLHQLEFYCLLCNSFFLDILLYVSIVFFSISGSICLTLTGPYSPLI